MTGFNRRQFINSTLFSAAAASPTLTRIALAGDSKEPIVAVPLAEKLFLLSGAGANVVAAGSPDGLVLVDGGLERHSKQLVKTALQATQAHRVATLFNTHWHPEQTGSNEALGRNGVKIIAHTNTKLWLTRRITVGWRAGTYGPFTGKALPGETFYAKADIPIGDEHLEYGYMPGPH
jgi:glyoxylase-like metal-dependent hydrolase (beta-lactamase superfamily II)